MLLALLLGGCGPDRPASRPPSSYPAEMPAHLPAPAASTSDTRYGPLLRGGSQTSADPLLSEGRSLSDPLLRGDSLLGRAMPTEHSHWLRGRLRDAHMSVLLNGIQEGEYSGVVDKDITMRLRKGSNSVTFIFKPSQTSAFGQFEIVESEHDPPLPPLVTFRSLPLDRNTLPKPMTQSFMFVAK